MSSGSRYIDISFPGFSKRLRRIRHAAGMTRKQLAAESGVSERTLIKYEGGKAKAAKDSTLLALCKALRITLDELIAPSSPSIPITSAPQPVQHAKSTGSRSPVSFRLGIAAAGITAIALLWSFLFGPFAPYDVLFEDHRFLIKNQVFGTTRFEREYQSLISVHVRAPWPGKNVVLFGLAGQTSDRGRLFAYEVPGGRLLWRDEPDFDEVRRVYGEEMANAGGFQLNKIVFADLEGDGEPEVVSYSMHSPWYPSYMRIYHRNGDVVGTYYFAGHVSDILVEDIDMDGKDEILAAGTNNAEHYRGGMLVLLDDVHCSGASADAYALPFCTLADSARCRVIFPTFDDEFTRYLPQPRLRACNIKTYGTSGDGYRIEIGVGIKDSTVVVALDSDLNPISAEPDDDFRLMMKRWPDSTRTRFEGEYLADWLAHCYRYEARPLEELRFQGEQSPTSSHILAQRYYTEGCEYLKRLFRDEARASFRNALAHDSTLVMAYVMQLHPEIRGTVKESRELIKQARKYEDRLGETDRLYFQALEAMAQRDTPTCIECLERLTRMNPFHPDALRLLARQYINQREPSKAIGCLKAATLADPTDGMSFNRLGYIYMNMQQYDLALKAINRYMKLNSSEPNPYDSRGDILAHMGRCREAIDSYRLALQHKSDFFPSLQSLGHMYLLRGEYTQAAEYYGRLGKVEDAGARGRSRFYQACIPAHQGKFKAALQALDEGTAADEREGITNSPYLSKLDLKSRVLFEMGDTEEALRVYRRLLDQWKRSSDESLCFWSEGYIRLLSAVDLPAAESYWKRIKNEMDSTGYYDERLEQACEGWLHLAEGNPQAAVICFEKACESTPVFRYRYALAAAYLQAGRAREAIEVLEKSLGACTENRAYYCIRDARARYLLATAYEEIGDGHNARKYYSEFTNMWASADSETAELTVARRRLAHPEPDLHHISKSQPFENAQEK